jgi:hypothetical protein
MLRVLLGLAFLAISKSEFNGSKPMLTQVGVLGSACHNQIYAL